MKKEDVKVKKLNNKGFSLVEIIIVIAIMAVLSGVLAPQLIKYIDKSRKSADIQTAQTIATAVNAALADESGYTDAANTTLADCYTVTSNFHTKIKEILGATPVVPKTKGYKDFYINVVGGNTVSIYALETAETVGSSGNQLYPVVGAKFK